MQNVALHWDAACLKGQKHHSLPLVLFTVLQGEAGSVKTTLMEGRGGVGEIITTAAKMQASSLLSAHHPQALGWKR